MDHSKKPTYLSSIDALRVLAILGVVAIHLTTKTLGVVGLNPDLAPFSLFLNQGARFAVPLFFFISGFVLEMNYRNSLPYVEFFKKRASRIIIPFLFWSILYFSLTHKIDEFLTIGFLRTLIQGKASYQLYFIPTLILFYLAFPFIHSFLSFLKRPLILGGLILLQILILLYDYYYTNFAYPYVIRIALLSWGMFLLGMVASHYKERLFIFVKKNLWVFITTLVLLLPIIFIHSKMLYEATHRIGYIYSQYHPLNYFYTIVLMGVVYYLLEKRKEIKIFVNLSKLSFFVFFVHVLVLNYVWKFIADPIINSSGKQIVNNIWFDPIFFILISGISFGLAFLAHKIPHASKITG